MSRLELSTLDARLSAGADGREADARRQAMACYLSAGEGWKDALRFLGGNFAGRSPIGRQDQG